LENPMTQLPDRRPIYVVDDSASVRAMLTDALVELGHEVMAFENGAEALHKASTIPPKLVLSDLNMAPVAGDVLCATLKERRPLTRVPVIIFTARDSAPEVMRSWRAGADDFLPKPVSLSQLKQKLKALEGAGEGEGEDAAYRLAAGRGRRLLLVDPSRFF